MLSIVTINFNNKSGLAKTIESVINQHYKEVEYIIIDGGSTDGSVELIESYKDHLKYWHSEKDNGIYNAMNIGLSKASQEYVLFLNSGDSLYNNEVLETIQPYFKAGAGIIYGDLHKIRPSGKTLIRCFDGPVSFYTFFSQRSLPHPSSFIRRGLLLQTGGFDEDMKLASDMKFFAEAAIVLQCTLQYVPLLVTIFPLDGASAGEEAQIIIRNEFQTYLKTRFPLLYDDYVRFSDTNRRYKKLVSNPLIIALLKVAKKSGFMKGNF